MKNKFYITTTLPYVNAEPHIGFALEIVQADVLARHQRSLGNEVVFNTGTDEHGLKIYRKALGEKKDIQNYVDEYATKFGRLKEALGLSYTNFIRTSDPKHKLAAQDFWKRCKKNGDIYKKFYKIKYCVGCELEKTDSEIINGRCPIHPNLILEEIEEENYFFRFSKYQKPLLDLYEKKSHFVVPDSRFKEIKNFVGRGLQDFSISRLKDKLPWGVSVPGDSSQIMYVWFDALVSYISTLGWPEDKKNFDAFWGTSKKPNAVQLAGKDNLRQQSAMWQAMLMSAGLPNSKQIVIHGFITVAGQKMAKSLGNVVNPFELVKEYGTDSVRYFLLREIQPTEDGDFTYEKFEQRYNSDLASGLGNLVARVVTLAGRNKIKASLKDKEFRDKIEKSTSASLLALENFRFSESLAVIWDLIGFCDRYVEKERPWEEGNRQREAIGNLLAVMGKIADLIRPFLPETSEKIFSQLETLESRPLFPRVGS